MKSFSRLLSLIFLIAPVACSAETGTTNSPERDATKHPYKMTFKKVAVEASLTFNKLPTSRRESNPFVLRFWDPKAGGTMEKGPFINPGFPIETTTVHPEMLEHGHGTAPVKVKEVVKNAGKPEEEVYYEVTEVYLTMKGEWDIQIDVKDGDKIVETVSAKHQQP